MKSKPPSGGFFFAPIGYDSGMVNEKMTVWLRVLICVALCSLIILGTTVYKWVRAHQITSEAQQQLIKSDHEFRDFAEKLNAQYAERTNEQAAQK